MKQYIFKLQWLFNLSEAEKAINFLGARCLTEINLKDIDCNTLDTFCDPSNFPTGKAERNVIKWIRYNAKNNPKVFQVELLRK
jgi:hypothetical protein